MNTQVLHQIENAQLKTDIPEFGVGDTVRVHTIIRDGEKQRIQAFQGIVIAINGSGIRKTFTVRKISTSIGVEKIFPLHSTNIDKIEFIKKGKVRKSKLYYMRDRIGKKATKITEGELSESMAKQHEELKNIKETEDQASATERKEEETQGNQEAGKKEKKEEEPKSQEDTAKTDKKEEK